MEVGTMTILFCSFNQARLTAGGKYAIILAQKCASACLALATERLGEVGKRQGGLFAAVRRRPARPSC